MCQRKGPQVEQDFEARPVRGTIPSILPWIAEWLESNTQLGLTMGGGKNACTRGK